MSALKLVGFKVQSKKISLVFYGLYVHISISCVSSDPVICLFRKCLVSFVVCAA